MSLGLPWKEVPYENVYAAKILALSAHTARTTIVTCDRIRVNDFSSTCILAEKKNISVCFGPVLPSLSLYGDVFHHQIFLV